MGSYKDTILKQEQIKWKRPPVKIINDDKVDLIITIPLTEILDCQAKTSYFAGANEIFKYIMSVIDEKKIINEDDVKSKLREMGLDIK